MSFKRLHQKRFDCQHDGNEGESIGQDARDVEQLKGDPDLETHTVPPPKQFNNEHDLPNQRQAGACGGSEVGGELRQHDVAQAFLCAHAELQIKNARPLLHPGLLARANSTKAPGLCVQGIRVNQAFGDRINWGLIPRRAEVWPNNAAFRQGPQRGCVSPLQPRSRTAPVKMGSRCSARSSSLAAAKRVKFVVAGWYGRLGDSGRNLLWLEGLSGVELVRLSLSWPCPIHNPR